MGAEPSHNRAPNAMQELSCGFCGRGLPLSHQVTDLAAAAGQVQLCRNCGAAYVLTSDSTDPRAIISDAVRIAAPRLQLTASPAIVELDGQELFLVCGWDPGEVLSTGRVAQILDLHRATVQQHVREGKFPGALLSAPVARGNRGFWKIPRGSLQFYLRAKGKGTESGAESAAGASRAARTALIPEAAEVSLRL